MYFLFDLQTHDIIMTSYFNRLTSHCYCYLLPHNSQDRLGRELYDASRDGNVERVAHLLGKGASVYWTDGASQTALHMVCYHSNQPDVVKLLLRNNRSINYQTSFSNTPLHYACIQGHLASVKLLLATGQCNLG